MSFTKDQETNIRYNLFI